MIKLLLIILLIPNTLIIFASTDNQLSDTKAKNQTELSPSAAAQALDDTNKMALDFCCIDESGKTPDDIPSRRSNSLVATLFKTVTSAVTAMVPSSPVLRFYNMSEVDLDSFIKSKATSANEHEGYREIETAILDAIDHGQTEYALLLFKKMSSKKSCFTRVSLKKIFDAAASYQRDIDNQYLQETLIYLRRTGRNTSIQDEAKKVIPSTFKHQTIDEITIFAQQHVEELRKFASQDASSAAATSTRKDV